MILIYDIRCETATVVNKALMLLLLSDLHPSAHWLISTGLLSCRCEKNSIKCKIATIPMSQWLCPGYKTASSHSAKSDSI